MATLFSNAAAAQTGSQVTLRQGGTYIWRNAGTFGGTTVKLQELGADGTTWADITSATMTAAGQQSFSIGAGSTIRAVLTGGAPTAFYSDIARAC